MDFQSRESPESVEFCESRVILTRTIASAEPAKRRKTQGRVRRPDRLDLLSVPWCFGSDLLPERFLLASIVMDGKFAFLVT
jgi:hypothetical protein